MPWLRDTTPRPPHWGQGIFLVPGLAPVPPQVGQLTTRGWRPAVSRAANSIAARLSGRLRRGIEFTVTIGS